MSGCAAVAPIHTVSASSHCDYETADGMCVHIDPDAKQFNPAALEMAYLQAKREIEARYHLNLTGINGPIIRVMSVASFAHLHPIQNRLDGDTNGDHGWTGFESGEIRITGPAVMRHEAFHYLLWKIGYSNQLNAMHEHPAFDEYRDGKWLPKRKNVLLPAASTLQETIGNNTGI